MSLRRAALLTAMVLPTLLWMACGQVYRPVVIPCSQGGVPGCPPEPIPTPANFHAVFGISANVPGFPGWATQIDVSGDTIVAETPINGPDAPQGSGQNPTHAAVLPNNTKLFVASAGTVSNGVDSVLSFTPQFQSTVATGFGPVSTVNLPSQTSSITAISESGNLVTVTLGTALTNVTAGYAISIVGTNPTTGGYNGTFAISSISGTTVQYVDAMTGLAACGPGAIGGACPSTATASIPPQPVFLGTTQGNAMYVANYNSNSIFAINTVLNAVSNSAPVGVHPVSLAETPNSLKLYVANQGDNSVSSFTITTVGNITTLSPNTVTGFSGVAPVWVVARGDSQKVYVLTQGDGQLVTIDTATDTVTGSVPVGAGANYIFFDPHLNRLYVTNPVTGMLFVFSDTGGANDTPTQMAAISFATGSAPCPAGCSPTSVTALADGSRFYVASYQTAASCPDPFVGASSACVIPGLTVFDATSITPKITPALTLLTDPPFQADIATNQYQFAVPPVAACASPVLPALYAPGATRFRVFATAATDSSHVYVSMCDAGAIADINTTDGNTNNTGGGSTPADALVTDLPSPYAGSSQASGSPVQSPIFMLTGQ
jgi:YVTN family beta-propeller protein